MNLKFKTVVNKISLNQTFKKLIQKVLIIIKTIFRHNDYKILIILYLKLNIKTNQNRKVIMSLIVKTKQKKQKLLLKLEFSILREKNKIKTRKC